MIDIDEMPTGYNIGWDVVGDICVTTGACPASNMFGGWRLRFETIIWNWDVAKEERTNMRDMIFHANEKQAEKVHGYIVGNLRNQLKGASE